MLLYELLQTEHDSSTTKNNGRRVEAWTASESGKKNHSIIP